MRFAIRLDIDEAACEAHILSTKGEVDLRSPTVDRLLEKVANYVKEKLEEVGIPNG